MALVFKVTGVRAALYPDISWLQNIENPYNHQKNKTSWKNANTKKLNVFEM